jgi:hypothetical protein
MGREGRQTTGFSEGGQATRFLISARSKAELYESSAQDAPFWRFRRRARLNDRARRARATEARLRDMVEGPDSS